MTHVTHLRLDVLKPHQPNILELAKAIAESGQCSRVSVTVEEVDDKTESTTIKIEGDDIQFDEIANRIAKYGGSLHSIDEVVVTAD